MDANMTSNQLSCCLHFAGLVMNLDKTEKGQNFFSFEHKKNYQDGQIQFWTAVDSFNPHNIAVRFCISASLLVL